MAIRGMNSKQVILMKNADVNNIDIRKLNPRGENFLTESGVYKLIFKSRKKEAEKFCDWVTDEVLPTIRKTGKYETGRDNKPVIPDLTAVKYYKGNPVMVSIDLEKLFNQSKEEINYLAVGCNIGTLLNGKNLTDFKKENPTINMKYVSVIRVFNRGDVVNLATYGNLRYNSVEVSEYFDRSELDDYDRFRLLELAKDIQNVAKMRGHNTPYEKMLNMVASKIYVDCGFLDEVTDDLSLNKPVGWNMQQPLIDFRAKVKKQLAR